MASTLRRACARLIGDGAASIARRRAFVNATPLPKRREMVYNTDTYDVEAMLLEDNAQRDLLDSLPAAQPVEAVAVIDAIPPDASAAASEPSSTPHSSRGENVLAILREMLETVIFALLVFLVVQTVSRNYKVQSISMQPNLYEGQYVVVNRVVYANGPLIDALKRAAGRYALGEKIVDAVFRSPQRGEVLVFTPVTNTKPDLIKRVIGIEGDKVELKQGVLYINDKPIDEPYIRPAPGQSFGPVVVGKDQLFVMGDNRGNSSDSRVFGMLPMKNVIGRAWLRYWPPSDWGFIRHYDLQQQLQ
jgi:signal peptidase I